MTRVVKRERKEESKYIKFNFDVSMLNSLIRYVRCEYVAKEDINNLRRVLNYTNIDLYQSEIQIFFRLKIIQEVLKAILDLNIMNTDLLLSQLQSSIPECIETVVNIGLDINKLTLNECEYIRKFVTEKLQHIEVYQNKDKLIELCQRIDSVNDFNVSYYETIRELKEVMGALLISLQEDEQNQGLLRDFSFSDADAANMLAKIVTKAQKPSSILQTGIRQLNAILAPGFQSSRLYTILGGSGKFKSGTLLNLADQIRLFNPQIIPYENGMRKCILFITLENSIEESVERLFDMYSGLDADIRKLSPTEVLDTLKNEGGFAFNGTSGGIDIYFKYAGNLEISTAAIYSMVTSLNAKGLQPICIVLDYIKRIESAHNSYGDERVRMSFVAKELKTIAQFYEIPVITAMQLNREGNSIIDAAMRDSKQDVARFVGSSSIGNAWDIIEDSDWVCLINLEMQKSTQKMFLTFKRLKIRGKTIPMATDYFNHPFSNVKNIRLEPDVNKSAPISVISLATDLESIDEEPDEDAKIRKTLANRTLDDRSSKNILMTLSKTVTTNMNSSSLV